MTNKYKMSAEEVLETYKQKFGDLPMMVITQAGLTDKSYIAMLAFALNRGTPVVPEDYDKFFPVKDGVLY